MTAPLAARAIRKSYGNRSVLHGIDLDLEASTVTVLLGANGAGKSTFVRILAGEMWPDHGVVKAGGIDALGATAPIDVAHVAQDAPLADFLSTNEHTDALIDLRGLEPAKTRTAVKAVATRLGLAGHLDRPMYALSGGMRQKAALSIAFAANTAALLLDEPYAGLDIPSALALRELIAERRADGAAILVASHLAEASLAVADRAVVLAGGRIAADMDSAQLASFGGDPQAFERAVLEAMT